MALNYNASGHSEMPDVMTWAGSFKNIVYMGYSECSLSSLFSRAPLLSSITETGTVTLFKMNTGGLDVFPTDNNEYPEVTDRPSFEPVTYSMCHNFKYLTKISLLDKYFNKTILPMIESAIKYQFQTGFARLLDHLTITTLESSAAPYNKGNNAGKSTGSHNLGTQDQNALTVETREDFLALIGVIDSVAQEAGWSCGTGEIRLPSESALSQGFVFESAPARPVLLLPMELRPLLIQIMASIGIRCCDTNMWRRPNGDLGDFFGYTLLTTSYLRAQDFNGTKVVPVIAFDPNVFYAPVEVISDRTIQHEFEDRIAAQFIYDALCINNDGVIKAFVKVPQNPRVTP